MHDCMLQLYIWMKKIHSFFHPEHLLHPHFWMYYKGIFNLENFNLDGFPFSFYISFSNLPVPAPLQFHSSTAFWEPTALPTLKKKKRNPNEKIVRHNVHLCIPAHTIPIHFRHKSLFGCNMRTICGPLTSSNSLRLEMALFRCTKSETILKIYGLQTGLKESTSARMIATGG